MLSRRICKLFCVIGLMACLATSQTMIYLGASSALEAISLGAQFVVNITSLVPGQRLTAECRLLGQLCHASSGKIIQRLLAKKTIDPIAPSEVVPSEWSWYLNEQALKAISATTTEDASLLEFLKLRWLAKSNGFYRAEVDWVCPLFGYAVSVPPTTTSSYARAPGIKASATYLANVTEWKKRLPHPESFPLLLTRPADLREYLPSYVEGSENLEVLFEKALQANEKALVDVTALFPENCTQSKEWMRIWSPYREKLLDECRKADVDWTKLLCIQRVREDGFWGLRILPLGVLPAQVAEDEDYLLTKISQLGLSANPIELDRKYSTVAASSQSALQNVSQCKLSDLQNYLEFFKRNWTSPHPEKQIMVRGSLEVIQGGLDAISHQGWTEKLQSSTRIQLVERALVKMKEGMQILMLQPENTLLFDVVAQLEQLFSHFTTLLEIFSPFTPRDFEPIYKDRLTSVPSSLKPLTQCALSASAMTSLTGIFKAVETMVHRSPRFFYGENTYFECVFLAQTVVPGQPLEQASDEELRASDLIVAQFNPALRTPDCPIDAYQVEPVQEVVAKALKGRTESPLTLALDVTIDFINSPRVEALLTAFQEEILSGKLQVIGFRSGLKYDLFGIDNYAGAPLFMIHNADPKWVSFNRLLHDPALQSDRLSHNWFCLAYREGAPYLEAYRKTIFDNTRSLLSAIPPSLFERGASYRVIPMDPRANTAFVDIRVSGPLHQARAAALVGGLICLKCLENGHPIFYRRSLGFYHTNFGLFFGKEISTIRLTLGLDPAQIPVLTQCLETIAQLN